MTELRCDLRSFEPLLRTRHPRSTLAHDRLTISIATHANRHRQGSRTGRGRGAFATGTSSGPRAISCRWTGGVVTVLNSRLPAGNPLGFHVPRSIHPRVAIQSSMTVREQYENCVRTSYLRCPLVRRAWQVVR